MGKLEDETLLLRNAQVLLNKEYESQKNKGELFNTFSILKMETAENKTHSNFIAELLNPKGSHLKGSIFLELFLKEINYTEFEAQNASVKLEKYIGEIDTERLTGGKIDIYIQDKNGNIISIENKINAKDQAYQIERYCNHEKGKNRVYYLSLTGKRPTIKSNGEFDYKVLSYKENILRWLDQCLVESTNENSLRESIKQYRILIKKLTYTMENEFKDELHKLILANLDAAQNVANNINEAKDTFRKEVYGKLVDAINNNANTRLQEIEVFLPNDRTQYTQIWLHPKQERKYNYLFWGIESFNGSGLLSDKDLYFGIFISDKQKFELDCEKEEFPFKKSEVFKNCWLKVKEYEAYNGVNINFSSNELFAKIATDSEFKNGLIEDIVNQTICFIKEGYQNLVAE